MKTIKVTQKHIDQGVRDSPDGCAIALALRAHIKGEFRTRATNDGRLVLIRTGRNDIYFPKAAYLFSDKFDNKEPVKPMSFKLRL